MSLLSSLLLAEEIGRTLTWPCRFIHFILFVLACIATDDKIREYSDIIFISRETGKEDEVKTLPSSLWEVVKPTRLPMAVAVNQYVRFVPGEDGTVRVAGDFGNAAT